MKTVSTKIFVIANSLRGKNLTIQFTNKKGETVKYKHDKVFAMNQELLRKMNCFIKYGNYTNSNKLPNWAK